MPANDIFWRKEGRWPTRAAFCALRYRYGSAVLLHQHAGWQPSLAASQHALSLTPLPLARSLFSK